MHLVAQRTNKFDIQSMGLYNEFIEDKSMDKLKRDLSKELVIDELDLTKEDISKCYEQSLSRLKSLLKNIQIAQTV